jgi:hypothetical protein
VVFAGRRAQCAPGTVVFDLQPHANRRTRGAAEVLGGIVGKNRRLDIAVDTGPTVLTHVIIAGGVILTLVASPPISTVTGIINAEVYTGPTVLTHVIIAGSVILTLVAFPPISTVTGIIITLVYTGPTVLAGVGEARVGEARIFPRSGNCD